jgi:hypothetical protein
LNVLFTFKASSLRENKLDGGSEAERDAIWNGMAYLEDQHSELVGIRAVAFLVDYF